jgi:hypothetical protein
MLTYWLTYYMEQSLSWEANRFSASQEITSILWNPKVHYRIHRRPQLVPILSQSMPSHPTSWKSVLILFSHLCVGLPNDLFPSDFPAKSTVYNSPVPHTCYMPLPSQSSRFDHPNNIWWAVHLFIQCVPLATEPGIEDIATKFEQEYVRCVRNEEECVCSAPNCCDTEQRSASQW